MGVAAAALAFLLWNRAAAQVGPHRAAPFMYLMPVWGALLSIVLLGETLLPVQWVTGAVLLAGLWLSWRSGTAARSRP
jgi:drug/metabolite transporter (DMT)-like permease